MSTKVLAIVQARSNSTRFPRKVLQDLHGKPMVIRQLERIRRSTRVDEVVVATSRESTDDELAVLLEQNGVTVHRGPLNDVLGRFTEVVEEVAPGHVVRLTADCPLTDPKVIDDLIELHISTGTDYSSNVLDRTFPHGLDAECMKADVFSRLGASDLTSEEREHVTMGIYRRPSEFSLSSLVQSPTMAHLRWTVDYPSDLDFARAVYRGLYDTNPTFNQQDILDFLNQHPQLVHTEADI